LAAGSHAGPTHAHAADAAANATTTAQSSGTRPASMRSDDDDDIGLATPFGGVATVPSALPTL
jgi:hypothetical protein